MTNDERCRNTRLTTTTGDSARRGGVADDLCLPLYLWVTADRLSGNGWMDGWMDDGRVDGRGGGARDIYCVLCVPYAPVAYIPITLLRCTCARYADANQVPLVSVRAKRAELSVHTYCLFLNW